ncbi:unnamed protein product [Lasius platythorax]|uniref:Uncharacterized protein n=1 Tax=Lasius platythorax TaxID=488582 RepID=A0AAV2NPV7_9HYME
MSLTSCFDRHNNDASVVVDGAVYGRQWLSRSSPFPWSSAWIPHAPDRPDCTVSPCGNHICSRIRVPIVLAIWLSSK